MKNTFINISLIILLLTLLFFTSACNNIDRAQPNSYTGRALTIGIIGSPPVIIENKTVTFVPITFEDLTSDRYKSFDAIFIMKERLLEASNDKYSKTFTQLQKPIIFIGTNTLIPFRLDGILYHPKEFQEGLPYSKGFIDGTEYGFGLYNDKENKASIQLFYSELFRLFE